MSVFADCDFLNFILFFGCTFLLVCVPVTSAVRVPLDRTCTSRKIYVHFILLFSVFGCEESVHLKIIIIIADARVVLYLGGESPSRPISGVLFQWRRRVV